MNKKIRLLLVDDQYLFLESLKLLIEIIAADMEICGTAVNGEDALIKMRELNPDVILMDVRMPVMDGVAAAKIIHAEKPDILIIMLTTFDDDDYVSEAMKDCASGYLLKNIDPQMLVSAIRAVYAGNILIDPSIAGNLVQNMYLSKRGENLSGETLPDWYYELSTREKNVIKHILLGKNNREIAADIHVGEQTIRNYISTLYTKLKTPDRRSLIAKAREISPSFFS